MNQIKVQIQEIYGDDRSVAMSAWTSSYDSEVKELKTDEDVARVVNMLADLKHSVPFESIICRIWMRLPIAIDRQHMTHRIGSHSGMSGRYRTMPNEYYDMPDDVMRILGKADIRILDYASVCSLANQTYNKQVEYLKQEEKDGNISNKELKRAREFLRGMLPQHNITERVSIMNLRSLANYIKLRAKPDAQPEIQYIAREIERQLRESGKCPIAIEALERNNWII